jgi:hypothetical protein
VEPVPDNGLINGYKPCKDNLTKTKCVCLWTRSLGICLRRFKRRICHVHSRSEIAVPFPNNQHRCLCRVQILNRQPRIRSTSPNISS